MSPRAIIVVTGATAGIGFGICHRLIDQLCHECPPDLADEISNAKGDCFFPCESLTLVLPCRSIARGEKARTRLLNLARNQLRRLQRLPGYSGHAERFISALEIDVLYCDLASISSVLEFGRVVSKSYPYVTHIINNAGTGSFLGINLWKGVCEFFKDPVRAVTAPNYKIEVKGEKSADGLGWVWQCNVFGHYVIYRVLWMSSLEAIRECFDPVDWQLTETEMPYEGSKCQMDLLSITLDHQSANAKPDEGCTVRHAVIQPGVVDTDILGATQIGFILNLLKLLSFYLARILFSQNHTVLPYTAAISAVFVSLIPQLPDVKQDDKDFEPIKYGSKTKWNGTAFIGEDKVEVWTGNEQAGIKLMEQMSSLYDEFCQSTTVSGTGNTRD